MVLGRNAFGQRDLEEVSGALFGVRAKDSRLSTWRLFLFCYFAPSKKSNVDRQRLEQASFVVPILKSCLNSKLNCPPSVMQNEEGPAQPHRNGAITEPLSVRRHTRVYALERLRRYQSGYALSTIYCGLVPNQ